MAQNEGTQRTTKLAMFSLAIIYLWSSIILSHGTSQSESSFQEIVAISIGVIGA